MQLLPNDHQIQMKNVANFPQALWSLHIILFIIKVKAHLHIY